MNYLYLSFYKLGDFLISFGISIINKVEHRLTEEQKGIVSWEEYELWGDYNEEDKTGFSS